MLEIKDLDTFLGETQPHRSFSKIQRVENIQWAITEKLDGTNGVIFKQGSIYEPDHVLKIGSRNRWLDEHNDNHGFYNFVMANVEQLANLNDGFHYGEFVGPGIQKNRYNLPAKKLFFFNQKVDIPLCYEYGIVPIYTTGCGLPSLLYAIEAYRQEIPQSLTFKETGPIKNAQPSLEGLMIEIHFDNGVRRLKLIVDK